MKNYTLFYYKVKILKKGHIALKCIGKIEYPVLEDF